MATAETLVREVMTKNPTCIREHDSLQHAAEILANQDVGVRPICDSDGRLHRVRRVPVVENEKLVGIVSQADIARTLPAERTGQVIGAISR